MKKNPLKQLETFGQAIWLDYIKRDLIEKGQLQKLIEEDGLRGMTSNPTIFEKAIAESHEYDQAIQRMSAAGKDVQHVFAALTQKDVGDAADQFRPLYDELHGQDGFVSLEVNPHFANDTEKTIEEARSLWKALNRPNVFIKVPATKQGIPAIQQLISEGININVTLLFGLPRYLEVAESYMAGIETRIDQGKSVANIASVASFFLSRIDVLLDPLLEKIIAANTEKSPLAKALQGQMAIASAKMAYHLYKGLFTHERFKKLAQKGAKVQRLLWASTSTKNPQYSDIKYVEALIGAETVNTLPLETIDAYRDHGDPKARLELDFEKAVNDFKKLTELSIQIDQVTEQLEKDGVNKFNQSYDKLIETLQKKMSSNVREGNSHDQK